MGEGKMGEFEKKKEQIENFINEAQEDLKKKITQFQEFKYFDTSFNSKLKELTDKFVRD